MEDVYANGCTVNGTVQIQQFLEGTLVGGRKHWCEVESNNFWREHWCEVESNNFGREHLGGNIDFCFATVCSILYYFVVICVLCQKMPPPKQDKHAPGPTGRTITLPKNYGE